MPGADIGQTPIRRYLSADFYCCGQFNTGELTFFNQTHIRPGTRKYYLKKISEKQSKSRTKEQVSFIGQVSKTRKKDPDTSGFIFQKTKKNATNYFYRKFVNRNGMWLVQGKEEPKLGQTRPQDCCSPIFAPCSCCLR